MGPIRSTLLATVAAGFLISPAHSARTALWPQGGKPFDGTKLNILSVVTPQFDGLMLRDNEFTELTGIETEWTFIPFGSLQEKVTAEGIAANGQFDVINYLDSWGPPNAHGWSPSMPGWGLMASLWIATRRHLPSQHSTKAKPRVFLFAHMRSSCSTGKI